MTSPVPFVPTVPGPGDDFRCGTVAIVGRPNVGKSTLLNHLIGQKLSITSRKPQTTRQRVKGIVTRADAQFVFVDTPGFQIRYGNALNRAMNRQVTTTLADVDVVLLVIEALHFGAEDQLVLERMPPRVRPILVVNKIDRVKPRERLLPFLGGFAGDPRYAAVVPVSARKGQALQDVLQEIRPRLPVAPPMYAADDVTDGSERFFAAEFVREQLFRLLGDELPYAATVVIDDFKVEGRLRRIHATILVDSDNQKAMVIGRDGEKLKEVGTRARLDLERLVDGKVFLQLWVKVKGGWADDERVLKSLGYEHG